MAHLMFNIPDEVAFPFRKLHRGSMSQIITDFLRQYMQVSLNKNQKITQRKQLLDERRKDMMELAAEIEREQAAISQYEEQQKLITEEKQTQDAEIQELVNEHIAFAKSQGRIVDLIFEAEKAGFKEVKDYLYKQHKEARE